MKLKAFTLIETILYLALFNVIFFAVITWGITLTQSNRNAEYKNAIEKNAIFLSEHLGDTFKRGVSVDAANSDFNVSTGKVRVNLASGYLEYENVNNVIKVTNGTSSFDLTDRFVQVTNFTVSPVIIAPNTIIGANITITFVAEKFPTLTKTIQSYYAFR